MGSIAHTLAREPSLVLVGTIAVVLCAGVLGLALAHRLRLPAILFLLALGLALGPGGLGLVRPELLGSGLRAIVSISVAIIVFEGAMSIDLRQIRHASSALIGLISVSPFISALGAGLAAHFVAGLTWHTAALYGAIMSVTGPTVVKPIVKRLALAPRLHAILEAESVFVDALGVLLGAAVLSYITAPQQLPVIGLWSLVAHILIGGGVGGLLGMAALWGLSRARMAPGEIVRLAVLSLALIAWTVAEVLAHESGLVAVAIGGLVLGSARYPHAGSVKVFKSDLSTLALAVVFILLAASQRLTSLARLGWGGVGVVAVLMLLIRPLAVFVATSRSSLSWREKVFVSAMGPRGIVAASMASFLAVELRAWAIPGAGRLSALVFLTVVITVLVVGISAGWFARRLGLIPIPIVVVGNDDVALWVARHLQRQGEGVVLVDRHPPLAAREEEFPVERADLTQPDALDRALATGTRCMVVATASDKANLMICQQARAAKPGLRLIARLNDRAKAEAFASLGIEVLNEAEGAGLALATQVTRPSVLGLLSASPQAEVAEIPLGPIARGQTLQTLNLPSRCLVALIRRSREIIVPDGRTELASGDLLTVIGEREAIESLRRQLGTPAAAI